MEEQDTTLMGQDKPAEHLIAATVFAGILPDNFIATHTDYTREQIGNIRKKKGLPPPSVKIIVIDPENPSIKEQIAADPDLGTVSDQVIGERFGVSGSYVSTIRRDLGVQSYKDREKERIDALLAPLAGKYSDHEVSRMTEIHYQTVLRYRSDNRIAAFRDGE